MDSEKSDWHSGLTGRYLNLLMKSFLANTTDIQPRDVYVCIYMRWRDLLTCVRTSREIHDCYQKLERDRVYAVDRK